LEGWKALAGSDPIAMRRYVATLGMNAARRPQGGRLKGLLFGDPKRFLTDLAQMLALRASIKELAADKIAHPKQALANLIGAAEAWQHRNGYQNNWYDPDLHAALRRLHSPAIDAVLNLGYEARPPYAAGTTAPEEQVRQNFREIETYTPKLIAAMKTALRDIR
jgi:hypothetical protein